MPTNCCFSAISVGRYILRYHVEYLEGRSDFPMQNDIKNNNDGSISGGEPR